MRRLKEKTRSLWEPGSTLSQRVVRSGFWAFALRIADRLFKLIRTIVLARILTPSDFGLMGVALLAVFTLRTFSQTGFQAALIQERESIKEYFDAVWTVSALRGLVLFIALYLAASPISLVFDTPAAAPIIQVISISMLLNGLTNIGVVYFQKELEFNKQFIYRLSGALADLIVAIIAAALLRSVWALVLGFLAETFVRLMVSYTFHPHKPKVSFEPRRILRLFSYSRWVMLSSILTFIGGRGDDVIVGKVIGASALGLYQMAYRISQLAVTETSYVIWGAAFPAYSKLQDKSTALRKAYFRIAGLSATLSVPIAVGTVVIGGDFTKIFLGEEWLPMVPTMAVLAAAALIESLVLTGSPLFMGSGNPKSMFQVQLWKALTIAALAYPFSIKWGILGTGLAMALSSLSMLIVWYVRIKKQLKPTLRDWTDTFAPPFISSLAMVSAIRLFKMLTKHLLSDVLSMQILWFLIAAFLAGSIYFGIICLCQLVFPRHQVLKEMLRIIRCEQDGEDVSDAYS